MITKRDLLVALKEPATRMHGLSALKTRYRPIVCPLEKALEAIPEHSKIYDIGCGSGVLMFLALRLRAAFEANGYDVSEKAIDASRAFSRDLPNFSAELRKDGTVPDLSTYDVVTMIDVFHHLPPGQRASFLDGLFKKMKPGARFVLMDIDASRRVRAMCNQLHDLVLAREWVHPVGAEAAEKLLLSSLDDVKSPLRYSTLWYGHYLITGTVPRSL